MIISRTPLRMSFVGGGSDLPSFYRQHNGAVLSTAINKYIYINVNKKFDNGIRLAYSKTEEVTNVDAIEHNLVKAALKHLGIDGGVEITSIADIPSQGTGLGSSSSFTVGLLQALNAFIGKYVSSEKLGKDSCSIEIDICGEPIGKQDQYAAAYGGFNLIEFKKDDSVIVSPVICKPETIQEIEANTLVFYTGITRSASSLLKKQVKDFEDDIVKQNSMIRMVDLAYNLFHELQNNNVKSFGEILHENWMIKKSLSHGVSTSFIDDCYKAALDAGASGGKILGAGSGGFLMLNAPKKNHNKIKTALSGLRHINMGFEPLGSRIIFYH
jgi:D-glycero-alpha-D-manno-heptose-7-phosphate kinase